MINSLKILEQHTYQETKETSFSEAWAELSNKINNLNKKDFYNLITTKNKQIINYYISNIKTNTITIRKPNLEYSKKIVITKTIKSTQSIKELITACLNMLLLAESTGNYNYLKDCQIKCSLIHSLSLLKQILSKEELKAFIKKNYYLLFRSYKSMHTWRDVNKILDTKYNEIDAFLEKGFRRIVPKILKEIIIFLVNYLICYYFKINTLQNILIFLVSLKYMLWFFNRSKMPKTIELK